jgi:hypothetical protein
VLRHMDNSLFVDTLIQHTGASFTALNAMRWSLVWNRTR